MKKTEEAKGWGIRVDGPDPYLWYVFGFNRKDVEAECAEPYHRPVRCVLVPLAEWRRLRRLDKENSNARE